MTIDSNMDSYDIYLDNRHALYVPLDDIDMSQVLDLRQEEGDGFLQVIVTEEEKQRLVGNEEEPFEYHQSLVGLYDLDGHLAEESKSDDQTASKSDDQTASKSDDQTASKSDDQTASKSDDQTASKSDDQTASKSDDQTASKSDSQMGHNVERPHKCIHCPKAFIKNRGLKQHVSKMHKNRKRGRPSKKVKKTSVEEACTTQGVKEVKVVLERVTSLEIERTCRAGHPKWGQGKADGGKISSKVKYKKRPYKCNLCLKGFSRKDLMLMHTKTHFQVLKEKDENALKEEKRKHKQECHICHKLISKGAFKRHLMRHNGERPHKCHHCPKAFIRKSGLKQHMLNKHKYRKRGRPSKKVKKASLEEACATHSIKEVKVTLERVTLSEIERNLMLKHTKTHFQSLKKKADCPIGGVEDVKFNMRRRTGSHLQKQKRERIECEICLKSIHASEGKRHYMRHFGIKPFKCRLCNGRFIKKSNLTSHHKVHHKGRELDYIDETKLFHMKDN